MKIWLALWTVLLFASLGWYSFLLFYIGYRGAKEIRTLTRSLDRARSATDSERDLPAN